MVSELNKLINADMAQLVEHVLGKDEVTSSNLVSSSRKKHICVADVLFLTKFACGE